MKKSNIVLKAILMTALIASCTKQRPEEFGQGQGSDLLSIADYQGHGFEVMTTEELSKTKVTSALELNDSQIPSNLDNMKLVKYESTSPLLSDVPFRGRAHNQYTFKYELTDKYLILNKVAPKELLPFQELTYATKISDNLYSVPMVGYPIQLIRVENILDGNGERTHRLSEFSAKNLDEATHFKIDKFNRVTFDAIKKNEIFPTTIFEGEWFYAATIVSASLKNATSIGRDISVDFESESVSRIKFIPTSNSVRAVNTNIDANIDQNDTMNLQTAVEIPVKWVDFRVKKEGRNYDLKEEMLDDSNKDSRHWTQRKYAEINFANVKSILTESRSAMLENVELSDDYLSFTVHYTDEQIKIKYALRKAHKAKEGRVYRKEDRKSLGLFTTTKHFINNHRFHRDEDFEKQVLMNHFMPELNSQTGRKEIRYFFSSNTPENMRQSGRRAITAWNDTFKAAGTDIDVILDESKTVSLGDLRYNIINIIDTKDGSGLLGYGPSIVDSESGEIISATTNIYANPFREGLISSIRNYIKFRLGYFKNSQISTIDSQEITIDSSSIDKWSSTLNSQLSKFESKTKENELLKSSSIVKTLNEIKGINLKATAQVKTIEQTHFGQKCSYQTSNSDTVERIESVCKEQIDNYVDELERAGITHNDQELSIIENCAEKLVEDNVVATLVHEMGHNFGMRHNFMASTDKENFIKNEDGKFLAATSSTMDYSNGSVKELLKPALYDEEVIRFAYGNSITLKDGSTLKLDTTKSIAQQLSEKGLERHPFKFCTDENIGEFDPMCQRWDYGTNPLEVATSIINNFNASYEINGHRHDRAFGPSELAFTFAHLQRTLIPLKAIHDQWRYHLAEFVTKRNRYLESFDEATFREVLEQMKEDKGVHGKNYALYYEANVKAYEFLKNLLETPARYCAVKSTENDVQIDYIDFEKLRGDLFKSTQVTIKDCNDPLAISAMKDSGFDYLKTVGHFVNSQKLSLDIADSDYDKSEVVGLKMLRRFAAIILGMRTTTFKQHAVDQFEPNFLDNPIYKNEISNYLTSRIVNGISETDSKISMFESEKDILSFAYEMFTDGIMIPGKIESSLARKTAYNLFRTSDPSIELPNGAIETRFANTRIIATPKNKETFKLVQKRKELIDMKNALGSKMIQINEEQLTSVLVKVPHVSAEEFAQMTLQDYINHLAKLKAFINGIPKESPVSGLLNEYFGLELNLADAIEQNLEQIKEMLGLPVSEFVTKFLKVEISELNDEGQALRAKTFVEENEAKIKNVEKFQANLDEYEAQIDLLTEILLTI